MDVIADILRSIVGRVHFMVYLGKFPAAEIELKDKEILIHIKNPLLALELGIEEMLSKKVDISVLDSIKEMGYKVKIKYKILEIEL